MSAHFGISIKRRIETHPYKAQIQRRWGSHFGISIKRRIETTSPKRRLALAATPISGFPSKEGLKPNRWWVLFWSARGPFRDFHQKKDWNKMFSNYPLYSNFPISGFPSKEGLKPVLLLLFGYCGTCPFRDFHQKKDWNTRYPVEPKVIKWPISGFPSKEGLKPNILMVIKPSIDGPFRDFHQKKDWNLFCSRAWNGYSLAHFGISIKRRIETKLLRHWSGCL